MLKKAICILLGYFLGGISASIVLSRLIYHNDIRSMGSGNAGATNMARCFGWKAGVFTLALDIGKCVLSTGVGKYLLGDLGLCLAGLGCIAGHCFPAYFHFKGGKAVSVGVAIAFMISPKLIPILAVAFFTVFFLTRIVSASSLAGAAVLIPAVFFITDSIPLRVLGVFTGIMVIIMHHENIDRLMHGKESKFAFKK